MSETDEHEAVTTQSEATTAQAVLPPPDPASFDELGDAAWPAQPAKSTLRISKLAAVLSALLLLSAGFWGGITLEKDDGSSGSGAGGFAAAFGSAGRTGAAAGGSGFRALLGGGSSNATTGTLTDIIGKALYVTTASGSLVKVTLASSTTVTRDAKASLSTLKVGDSVVVSGVKTGNGKMTASSISATAAGVSTGGGFGGLFGAGASGGSGTAASSASG
jgi:hypothetical protein